MTTQARIIANRQNATKSTGPKTQKGKAVVSQNALKHGLSARQDVIITESQEDFDLHRDAVLEELAPQGPMESMLADRLISLSWRLKRADQIQNQTFDAMHEKDTNNPLANLAKSFGLKGLGTPQPETSDPQADLTLGRIALKDFSNEGVLDRLLMYERRIEHSLYKTALELQRLHLIRNLNPGNEPPTLRSQHNLAPGFTGGSPQKSPSDPENKPIPRPHKKESSILSILPRIHGPFAQNKPNPQNPKTNTTCYTTKTYPNIPPRPARKNKPNQTHAIRRAFIPCLGSNLEYNVGTQYPAVSQNKWILQFRRHRTWRTFGAKSRGDIRRAV